MTDFASGSAQAAYRGNGYAELPRLFPPVVLGVFHARMQKRLNLSNSSAFVSRTPLLTKPALQVYSAQYPPMAAFHWGLTPVAAEIAGCELVPTYAFFRVYQQGDVCLVHSDRPACEHSLSLTVELADNLPWALCVERKRIDDPTPSSDPDSGGEEFTAVPMVAGDAVMYRGVNHRHGRFEPNPNRWSAHLFLHWVDAAGPYAEQGFDRVALERAGLKVA